MSYCQTFKINFILLKGCLLLIFAFPFSTLAKFGSFYKGYSFSAGQQIHYKNPNLLSLELNYEKHIISCTYHRYLHGFGINYSQNKNQKEIGLKGIINPSRQAIRINRDNSFQPYLFAQVNYNELNKVDLTNTLIHKHKGYSIRPGVGLTGFIRKNELVTIRTYLQLGYGITLTKNDNFKNNWLFEYKIGIGINTYGIRKH